LPAPGLAPEKSLEERIRIVKHSIDPIARNELIQDYIPFIIRVVSNQLNRYIETENSDEFSIGMIAFNEAIDKYDFAKGSFLGFAELVIKNRVRDLWRKKHRERREISLEDCLDSAMSGFRELYTEIDDDLISLQEEIKIYQTELNKFGISFEDLVTETPKHRDTRQNATELSWQISQDEAIVQEIFERKKLPQKKIVLKFQTTLKTLRRSNKYIISLVIILTGSFSQLRAWVK